MNVDIHTDEQTYNLKKDQGKHGGMCITYYELSK